MTHRARAPLAPAAAGLALALLAGPDALAAGGELRATAALAVARDPSGQKVASSVDAALRARVPAIEGLRLVDPARTLAGDPRTREEETEERARAALADGRRAYDALALDDAIARLGQAVTLLQQTGPRLGDLEELKVALAYLGASLVLRGSPDEGEGAFGELLTIAPGHRLEGFPPTVVKAFDRAVARLEATPSGSVDVYSTPPYAAVHVDGRFEGVTPLTLTDLVAGTHYLRLEKVGYEAHGAPLDVAPGQRITSQTRLEGIARGAELRDLAARAAEEVGIEGMGGSLRALGRLLVADTLVLVAVAQSGRDATLTGAVFDVASGARLATERAVLGADGASFEAELDAYLARLVGALGKAAASAPPALAGRADTGPSAAPPGAPTLGAAGPPAGLPAPAPDGAAPTVGYRVGPRPVPSEYYLGWTLTGLGGAALVTGGVFAILAKDVHSDFRRTAQLSPDLGALRDRGKTNALVADVSFLGGAVAAIGGLVIVLLSSGDEVAPARLAVAPVAGGGVVGLGGAF